MLIKRDKWINGVFSDQIGSKMPISQNCRGGVVVDVK